MILRLKTDKKVVGTKQVKKALVNDNVEVVFIAEDADKRLKNEIASLCKEKKISIIYVKTMEKLGKSCNIDVNAASAALTK